jgi:saccharopine dehydrogenase (NAD+, L-lysine-forming)
MCHNTILMLGGYGNAGLVIARLLASQTPYRVILAGRNGDRARQVAEQLNREFATDRVSGMAVDAASRASLLNAFQQVELVLVAASTIHCTRTVAEAALEAGIDYFDIQIAVKAKHAALEALRERIVASGRCFITDGGYRPGIPAAMVRYAACQIPGLESAPVASTFQVNWKERQFAASSAAEFADELESFSPLAFAGGQWQTSSMRAFKRVDFGAPFGVKYCMPMFLEEFRSLPEMIPSLQETGFFSSGFGVIVDYILMPLSFGLLKLFPHRSRHWIARLMEWGLKSTTHPPYGAVLRMEAKGKRHALTMTVSHDEPYLLTAAPAVACLLQLFDGAIRQPGLWRQATRVEPVRFFADLATLGVTVSVTAPTDEARIDRG